MAQDWRSFVERYANLMGGVSPTSFSNIQDPAAKMALSQGARGAYAQPVGYGQDVLKQIQQENEQAANIARQRQVSDLKEKMAQMKEAGYGDYNKTKNEIGGWNYFDQEGNPISAWDFSKGKGVSVSEALSGSDDPNDQQFNDDYKKINQILAMSDKEFDTWRQELAIDYPEQSEWDKKKWVEYIRDRYGSVFGQYKPYESQMQSMPTETAQPQQSGFLESWKQRLSQPSQGGQQGGGWRW